jgi:DNA-binding HxlR family transcriptional regulator
MNPDNSRYKQYNQQQILMALIDGQWHRIMDLKKETKLSPRTLYKHLNELEKELHWIERKEDTESGEYPHPVLYKANPTTIKHTKFVMSIHEYAEKIETKLKETRDPSLMLDDFHMLNKLTFTLILMAIQSNKYMTWKQIDYMTRLFLFSPYEIYTQNLITAITKAIQSGVRFEVKKPAVSQAKRQRLIPEEIIRPYEELGILTPYPTKHVTTKRDLTTQDKTQTSSNKTKNQ